MPGHIYKRPSQLRRNGNVADSCEKKVVKLHRSLCIGRTTDKYPLLLRARAMTHDSAHSKDAHVIANSLQIPSKNPKVLRKFEKIENDDVNDGGKVNDVSNEMIGGNAYYYVHSAQNGHCISFAPLSRKFLEYEATEEQEKYDFERENERHKKDKCNIETKQNTRF